MLLKPKILLIDDDPISLRILIDHLEGNHYALETSRSGEEAWERLLQQTSHYDVVIVDRLMEGMTGLDLLRKVKANERLKNIPVIMQTGEAEPEEFIEAIGAGAFDFIYKPVEQELLLYVVENALQGLTET